MSEQHSHTTLLAELDGLSKTLVFRPDTFKRARAAMKSASGEIARLRGVLTRIAHVDEDHYSLSWAAAVAQDALAHKTETTVTGETP